MHTFGNLAERKSGGPFLCRFFRSFWLPDNAQLSSAQLNSTRTFSRSHHLHRKQTDLNSLLEITSSRIDSSGVSDHVFKSQRSSRNVDTGLSRAGKHPTSTSSLHSLHNRSKAFDPGASMGGCYLFHIPLHTYLPAKVYSPSTSAPPTKPTLYVAPHLNRDGTLSAAHDDADAANSELLTDEKVSAQQPSGWSSSDPIALRWQMELVFRQVDFDVCFIDPSHNWGPAKSMPFLHLPPRFRPSSSTASSLCQPSRSRICSTTTTLLPDLNLARRRTRRGPTMRPNSKPKVGRICSKVASWQVYCLLFCFRLSQLCMLSTILNLTCLPCFRRIYKTRSSISNCGAFQHSILPHLLALRLAPALHSPQQRFQAGRSASSAGLAPLQLQPRLL